MAGEQQGEQPAARATLADVAAAAAGRRAARGATDDAYDEWRFAVGAAVASGLPVEAVAEAAGTTSARVHQVAGREPRRRGADAAPAAVPASAAEEPATVPYRCFTVRVARRQRLSPTFVRLTFTGHDLHRFADTGADQRLKLVLPLPGAGLAHFPGGPDWWPDWRALPDEHRNPVRTYTARAVRRELAEVDVDLVLHGDAGPASRWAGTAEVGDEVVLVGPDAAHRGDHGGIAWRPSPGARLLLAGDESAVPAIASILGGLPDDAAGEAFCEVPDERDAQELRVPAGVRLTWLVRGDGAAGSLLVPAVEAAVLAGRRPAAARAAAGADPRADPDAAAPGEEPGDELLWDVPEAGPAAGTYAWLAGEAGAVSRLRRSLVAGGVPRSSVAFMGYWRHGRSAAS